MRTSPALLLLLLFCVPNSFAGTSCPVDVSRAERYSSKQSSIAVTYKNISGKEIVGVALGVEMYGDDGAMKPLFFELRDREELAPGDSTEGAWTETLYNRDYPRVNVFVKKVKFSDATEWKDDGSGTCNSGVSGLVAKGTPSHGIKPSQQQSVAANAVPTASGHGDN